MMNTAQQTPVTDSAPTIPVSSSTTPPPPEAHQMTSQVPQGFALPTAAPIHSEVPTEPIPQMQPVATQSFVPSAEPVAPSEPTLPPQMPPSSFVPPKKSFPLKAALAVIIMVLTLVGGGAAYYLSQNSQDLRQQAASDVYPTLPPTAPPAGGSACSQGLYNCGSLSSNPAGCSSNAGQGCYYHQATSTCKCGSNNGGGGGGTSPSASCSGGKAHICGGSTGATFCVASCSNGGNYSGNSCTSGCNSNCTDVTVAANTCQDVGPGTSTCGRWQVDVHGAASCADSGCSSSGCGGGGGGGGGPSASVSISQSSCIALPGKYQTGSAITLTATGASTNTKTELLLGKVNAAGTGLDGTFNGNCPIGTAATGTPNWCKIAESTANNASTSWSPTAPGKYVIVSNGHTTGAACSGNPICSFNAGSGNPMTAVNCDGWTSCSNNDYIFFEIVPAAQCVAEVPPGPMCLSITAKKENGEALSVRDTLKIGDKVKFTCGTVSNVSTYGFRVIENGVKSPLETVAGTTSKVYTVTKSGQFVGQCTICPNGVCYPFTSTDP